MDVQTAFSFQNVRISLLFITIITIICCIPLEFVLRHGHLSVFSIRGILWMLRHGESALHLMHWERRPYPPNTIHEHIVPLLRVG